MINVYIALFYTYIDALTYQNISGNCRLENVLSMTPVTRQYCVYVRVHSPLHWITDNVLIVDHAWATPE